MSKESQIIKFRPTTKIKLDDVGMYYDNINRGVGTHKPKKGKGSYQRHEKHKNKIYY